MFPAAIASSKHTVRYLLLTVLKYITAWDRAVDPLCCLNKILLTANVRYPRFLYFFLFSVEVSLTEGAREAVKAVKGRLTDKFQIGLG